MRTRKRSCQVLDFRHPDDEEAFMKVLLSWSGERSKAVAIALREWLPDVIQDVEPWMSAVDIGAGERWGRAVEEQLATTEFGISCVTPENQTAPWIIFEAGALAKSIDNAYVCPYLVGMEPTDLAKDGPLLQFQAKTATKPGTCDLIQTLNRALRDKPLDDPRLHRSFERAWPSLKDKLTTLPSAEQHIPKRSTEDMIKEILEGVRTLVRESQLRAPMALQLRWLQEASEKARSQATGGLGLLGDPGEDLLRTKPGLGIGQARRRIEKGASTESASKVDKQESPTDK
jgi:hypothetical protein